MKERSSIEASTALRRMDSGGGGGCVYLVDDDSAFRGSLAQLLTSISLVCKDWDSPDEVLALTEFQRPGCVILDYRLPSLSGLEVLRKIRSSSDIPVVLISAYADVSLTVAAMQSGAAAVFEKPLDDNDFLGTIERLCYADRSISENRRKCLELQKLFTELSEPERDVFELMVNGQQNKAIAGILNKSVKSVERNRQTLLSKLGAASSMEAVLKFSSCPLHTRTPITCVNSPCGC